MLLIDEHEGFFTAAAERFETFSLRDINLREEVESLCFKYDVTEVATAVKPNFLRHLFSKRHLENVLYLDPDILVTAPLDALFARLETADAILTPHLDTDFPDDGKTPNTSSMLLTGAYNLGFLGVRNSPEGNRLLEWLQSKTETSCVVSWRDGYFYDQKFFDVAVTLFPSIHIERGIGYNMAPWNLHSRRLTRESGRWLCNGAPLYFYHFSNFKLSRPNVLSGLGSRFTFADRPDLQPMYDGYREALVANGGNQSSLWPYQYARLNSGERICNRMRHQYRDSLAFRRRVGNPFASRKVRCINAALTLWGEVMSAIRPRQRAAALLRKMLTRQP